MRTQELEYHLPPNRIAQRSVHPRDASKLIVVPRVRGMVCHVHFCDLTKFLRRGDVLVFNDTKVFRARLHAGAIEVLLLRSTRVSGVWQCLGKPGKKLQAGATVQFTKKVRGTVVAREENGQFIMQFFDGEKKMSHQKLMCFADAHGEIPLPPYVTRGPKKFSDYQTIFAKHVGSVAAPTAAFHFTRALRDRLKKMGVQIAHVTLHVGIGTFQPIKTDRVEDHTMHAEMVSVCARDARKIAAAKRDCRRVIAVGTTTTRALEGAADVVLAGEPFYGDVNMFITPGYRFKIIDGLITNFHLPRSTLMVLVGAFLGGRTGGVSRLKKLYAAAIKRGYRFFSFGDAMFIS